MSFVNQGTENSCHKPKTKKKYFTKYNQKYMEDYPWALSSSKGDTFAFCSLCKVDICIRSVGAKGLRDHESTCRHTQSAQQFKIDNSKESADRASSDDHSSIIPASLTADCTQEISVPSPNLSTINPEVNTNILTTTCPEMIVSVENASVISGDSSYFYSPSTAISKEPITKDQVSSFFQENLSAGISSSNCEHSSMQPHQNAYSVHLTRSTIYCPFEHEEKSMDQSCPCPNPPLTPSTPSTLTEIESFISKGSKFFLASISSEPIIEHVHSPTTPRLLHKRVQEITSTLQKEPPCLTHDVALPSMEDLTCNICGVLFHTWKELKSDLESHVKNAQQVFKRKNTPKKSSVRRKKKEEDKKNPRRRGRPLGSKNKTASNHLKLSNSTILKSSITEKMPQVRFPIQSSSKQQNSKKTSAATKSCPLKGEAESADPSLPEGEVTMESFIQIIESSSMSKTKTPPEGTTVGTKIRGQIHCRVCKASFYSRKDLRTHFQSHNNGRPFQCNFCLKFFTTKNHLKVHKSHKHLIGPNPCECTTCGKVLSSRTNLKIHMRIHKGEKPFECPICKKQFSRKANMEMHTVYHTGERRYTCEVCGQSFFAINNLKRHAKLHTGERNFACETCGATYVTGTDLRRHRLKHQDVKPFPCNLCGKQFTRSHDLKIHMRYHTKDLRFTCNICNKQFVESGNYKRHMRRHTGERPYMCNICMQTFSQVHHYKLHMRCNHANELDSNSESKHSKKMLIPKTPNSTLKMSCVKTVPQNILSHTTEPLISGNSLEQSPMNANLTSNQARRTQHTISNVSPISSGANLGSSGVPPIAHTVNVPVMQATYNPPTQSSSNSHSWNLSYNSYLYNSSVLPQYPSIVDVCPQQNSSHIGPH